MPIIFSFTFPNVRKNIIQFSKTLVLWKFCTFSCILQYCLPYRLVTGCFFCSFAVITLFVRLQPFVLFIRLLPFMVCPLTLSDKRHQSGLDLPPIILKLFRRIACDPVYSGI